MNIIGHRKIFLSISGILVIASIIAVVVFGLKPGIDFVGGTLWQLRLTQTNADGTRINADLIKNFFEEELAVKNITIYPS
ncbi:MAG TPA: hypothetical protein ENH26_00545, partial [Candidatus Wolfebacteria bacterium]|nr:hypothetical protein [Candidatus Wolfebacteria bacterium]